MVQHRQALAASWPHLGWPCPALAASQPHPGRPRPALAASWPHPEWPRPALAASRASYFKAIAAAPVVQRRELTS